MSLLSKLLLLVTLMAVIAWIDWRRHPGNATKWREYAFLLAAGFLGGLVGVAIDNLTATLSPQFFVFGKGLSASDGFRWRVTEFGFQAGLGAGVIVGGLYLIANNPKPNRPSLSAKRLFRFALRPLILVAILPLIIAPLVCWMDPLGIGSELDVLMTREEVRWFVAVWGINLGGYLGGIAGMIWGIVGIRRARKVLAADCQAAGEMASGAG